MVMDCAGLVEDESYPEELTIGEIDELHSEDFDNLDKAIEYVREHGGQVYTQVDGQEDRMYTRGVHVVNRTGIYAVAKKADPPHNCPNCKKPLEKIVRIASGDHLEWNGFEGTYKVEDAQVAVEFKCGECDVLVGFWASDGRRQGVIPEISEVA